jgi:hypothetical protein
MTSVSEQPTCPECRTPVQPSWDWCLACGFDPSGHRPADWSPGMALAGAHRVSSSSGAPSTPGRPPSTTLVRPPAPGRQPVVADARPQDMTDPDWATFEPPHRMSYLAVIGLIAAIVIAIGSLILVTVLVLHRPIGTTQANASGLAPALVSGPAAAAAG